MPSQSAIRVPLEEELAEIARDGLQLSSEHIPFFVQTVQRIARSLLDFQEHGVHPKEAIKRTRAALNSALKNLRKAHSSLSSEEELVRHFTDPHFLDALASLFSVRGAEVLSGAPIGFSFDEREIELAVDRSRDGGSQWIFGEIRRVALLAAEEKSARPLANLIDFMEQYVEAQIDFVGPTPKGQPKNQERQFALSHLSTAHPKIFGVDPTPTPSGKFCQMCEAVFETIGLSTSGLDTAISRHLARQSKA